MLGLAVDNPSVMSGGDNYMGSGLFFPHVKSVTLTLILDRREERGRDENYRGFLIFLYV
jgi:hypothetical protein